MDTSVLAAIIGGLAAVLGLGMAVIAILASRSMKAAQANQPQKNESGEQPAESPTEMAESVSENDPNAFVDPFAFSGSGSGRGAAADTEDDPTAFTDPFAKTTGDEDAPLEWGSAFDDPAVNPDEQWGFDADDNATSGEYDPLKPRPDSKEGT